MQHTHDTNTWNIHRIFIHIYRNQKTRNSRYWFRYETFYYLWVKGFSTWGERDTQSFFADCFYIVSSQPKQRAAPEAHKFVLPRPALNVKLSRSEAGTQLSAFLKSQNPQPTLPGMTSFTSLVPFPIWEFYFDICEWRILSAHRWTPALMLYLTNPCTKQKVLILTKPKGKIYKTKSLRHYITRVVYIYINIY